MAGGQAHALGRRLAQPRLPDAGAQYTHRLIQRTVNQASGLFLAPFKAAFVAIDTNAQRVFFPGADLTGDQRATGALLHL